MRNFFYFEIFVLSAMVQKPAHLQDQTHLLRLEHAIQSQLAIFFRFLFIELTGSYTKITKVSIP